MSIPETPFSNDLVTAARSAAEGDPVRSTLEQQLHLLGDLTDAGMLVARAVAQAVTAPSAEQPLEAREVAELALAYERVARAVRYTVMLQSRLVGELEAWEQAQASPAAMAAWQAKAAREAEAAQARAEVQARKAEAAGALGRVIAGEHADAAERDARERCEREAGERLNEAERLGELMARPVSEIIDIICRGLGIQPDWLRLSDEAWARGELRSGKVGAALAAAVMAGEPPVDAGVSDPSRAGGRGARAPLSRPSWRPPIRSPDAPRRRRAAG